MAFELDPAQYEALVAFGPREGFYVGRDKRLQRQCLFQVVRAQEVELSRRLVYVCSELANRDLKYVPMMVNLGVSASGDHYTMSTWSEGAASWSDIATLTKPEQFVLELGRGLLDLHSQGLVHRDICFEVLAVSTECKPIIFDVTYCTRPKARRQVASIGRLRPAERYDPPEARTEEYDGITADIFNYCQLSRAILGETYIPIVLRLGSHNDPRGRPYSMGLVVAELESSWGGAITSG